MTIKNKNDLDIKYLVFKLSDIDKYLTTHEYNLIWSFIDKIIKCKNKAKEFNRSNKVAKEIMIKQFKYDINNYEHKTVTLEHIIELMEKYNL